MHVRGTSWDCIHEARRDLLPRPWEIHTNLLLDASGPRFTNGPWRRDLAPQLCLLTIRTAAHRDPPEDNQNVLGLGEEAKEATVPQPVKVKKYLTWMARIEREDAEVLKELGNLVMATLMEKIRGLQNLACQLGLEKS
ncbi:Protein lin-52 like protein [Fukomys damarensis]|uniref:Protein lin-52 homolog n=1 Tax=Fukomys damarensis TaxID=885580 RepID=A0A091DGJ6_FUKDA|nr:Protein lin-52 like protein [Fukomys damarensis]